MTRDTSNGTLQGGLTDFVQFFTQIVVPMVDCLTSGFVLPGVNLSDGRTCSTVRASSGDDAETATAATTAIVIDTRRSFEGCGGSRPLR